MKIRYVHWKQGSYFLGYLEDYPHSLIQGETEEILKGNLLELYKELSSRESSFTRKVDELVWSV